MVNEGRTTLLFGNKCHRKTNLFLILPQDDRHGQQQDETINVVSRERSNESTKLLTTVFIFIDCQVVWPHLVGDQ